MNTPTAIDEKFCQFCRHIAHPVGKKCSLCNCKGKPKLWQKFMSSLGNALGDAAERR